MEKIPIVGIADLRCEQFAHRGQSLEIIRIEEFNRWIGRFTQPHRHDFYMLLVNESGTGEQMIDFQNHIITSHSLFLMYPGQVHAWGETQFLNGYLVFFNDEFLNQGKSVDLHFCQYGISQPRIDLQSAQFNKLQVLLQQMNNIFDSGASNDGLKMLWHYLQIVLMEIHQLYCPPDTDITLGNQKLLISQFKSLIDQQFSSSRHVKDYARQLFVSPNYLNAICKMVTGKSAGELIRDRVMLEAKRLLIHENGHNISWIAYHLGFEDNSYFSRFFKKHTQRTPEVFRKQHSNLNNHPYAHNQ